MDVVERKDARRDGSSNVHEGKDREELGRGRKLPLTGQQQSLQAMFVTYATRLTKKTRKPHVQKLDDSPRDGVNQTFGSV